MTDLQAVRGSPLLTVAATARELGVSKSYLYELAGRREIACYRLGTRIMFSDAQIRDYLDRCLCPAREASGG